MWIGSYFGGVNYYPRQWTYFENSTLVMILKILGVGYVSSVKVMMVLFGLVLKIRDYFILSGKWKD